MNHIQANKQSFFRKALTTALVCAFIIQPFTPIVAFAATGSTNPVGYIDSISCANIVGWTYDGDNSSAPIDVHFYTDNASGHSFIGSASANVTRADVNATEGVSGDHGFSFPTPDSLKDGQTHLVYAYGIDSNGGTNTLISNSPVTLSGCSSVLVVNTAPTAPIVTVPASAVFDTAVTFSAVSTDPQGDQIAYGYDWNNDTVVDTNDYTAYAPSGSPVSFSKTFATAGTYTINVYARDAFGAFSPASTVQYTATASGSGGTPVTPAIGDFSVFNISPTVIQSGETAVISWISTNATLCIASGDWTGQQALSNTFNVGVQTTSFSTTKTYILECGNAFGTTTKTANLTINPVAGPGGGGSTPGGSVSFITATPSTVLSGQASVLSWASTNANLCVASGAWTGIQSTAGTFPITATTTSIVTTTAYSISCGNIFGTTTGTAILTINPTTTPATTIDFTVSPLTGLTTSESGGTASFAVALASVPSTTVTLPIRSSNFAEGTTSVTSLVFTPADWNLPKDVTVTGQDDAVSDGSISYTVTVGASISADPVWNNLAIKTVAVTNTDNEAVVVVVPPTGGGTTPTTGGGGRGGGGGGGPCVGFGCASVSTTTPVTYPDITITFPTPNTGGTRVSGPELVCPSVNFITAFLRKGIDNNPNEVRKLQYFLNTYENARLTIDGDFNLETETAVKALQSAHSDEILAPWGVTESTGIVYITTARYINRVFCGDNPTYSGNESIKDILDTNVFYINPDNSGEFDGAIGQATTSSSTLSNIAGAFGAVTQGVIDFLKDIPWYPILILFLLLVGAGFLMRIIFTQNLTADDFRMSLIRGVSMLAVGTVLNVLNTLSFKLNPVWFVDKAGFGLNRLLTLDAVNLFVLIAICLALLIALYNRLVQEEKGL